MAGKREKQLRIGSIPAQSGHVTIVTGASGGIGFETALALAGAGSRVVIAARSVEKSNAAIGRIKATFPDSDVQFEAVDLGSLASVADFARRIDERYARVDVLVNNAGVMAPPTRQTTSDGYELQFGVNYLAHFALTARLLPALRRSATPRVVTVSSVVHKFGNIDFSDLQWERRRYSPTGAYHDSKLANLMFALELQRQSDLAGWGLHSMAAHPGIARTDLMANGPGLNNLGGLVFSAVIAPFFSHSAAEGALPVIYAATSSAAEAGGFYGPSRRFELVGPPGKAKVAKPAMAGDVRYRLWQVSETLANFSFPAVPSA